MHRFGFLSKFARWVLRDELRNLLGVLQAESNRADLNDEVAEHWRQRCSRLEVVRGTLQMTIEKMGAGVTGGGAPEADLRADLTECAKQLARSQRDVTNLKNANRELVQQLEEARK